MASDDEFDSHQLYKDLDTAIASGRPAVKIFLASLDLIRITLKIRMATTKVRRDFDTNHGLPEAIAVLNTDIAFDKNSIYILNNIQTRAEVSLSKITKILKRR